MRAAYGITPYLDCASGLGESFLWTLFHHLPLIWLQDQLQGFVWKGADALPRAPLTKCVWLQLLHLPVTYGTPAGYAALFNVAYNVRYHFTHKNSIAHQSNIMSVHLSVPLLAGHDFRSDSWQV